MESFSDKVFQICFGILGVIIALAGLHYRDSVGCILFRATRRFREPEVVYHELPTVEPVPEDAARYIEADVEQGIASESPPPLEPVRTALPNASPPSTNYTRPVQRLLHTLDEGTNVRSGR